MILDPYYPGHVIALDIKKKRLLACVIRSEDSMSHPGLTRDFNVSVEGFNQMAAWCQSLNPSIVALEGRGVHWVTLYRKLHSYGLEVLVVDHNDVKRFPSRDNNPSDCYRLAFLTRFGMLDSCKVPPPEIMDIQTLTLYRKEVLLNLSTAKNLVKSVLTEVGIRIGEVVKDLNGPTYRKMVWGFINGATPEEALQLAGNSFKGDRAQALEALSGDLSPIRRTTLKEMVQNIERFEEQVARLESHIIKAVQPYQEELQFLRNITTLGEKEVALVVAELGPELLGIVDLEALSDAIDQVLGYRRRN